MLNTKGIGPVVAVALLIVIAVSAVIGFQVWFNTYSSNLFTDIETKSNSNDLKIDSLIGNKLYVSSDKKDNLSIKRLSVGGNECSINKNLSTGMNTLNVSSCISNISESRTDIVLTTNSGVLTKTVFIDDLTSSNSGNLEVTTIETDGNFELLSNGVVTCNSASVGDTGTLDGVTYTKRTDLGINTTNANTTCTSDITDMGYMFYNEASFNQSLDNFDTSKVIYMNNMFQFADSFNQPLDNFDTSNVTLMNSMFAGASSFNQPLDNFDTSKVVSMRDMFRNAEYFNQPLESFDTSNVKNMRDIFYRADSFNQPLDNFDTSNVTNMRGMFQFTNIFNQPLDNFDTSNVTDMSRMFRGADSFNQSLDNFDTSNVTDMSYMFSNADSFNQPLNFNTSNVTDMGGMFQFTNIFNQPLDNFDTSNVIDMNSMFYNATAFNQNISSWCVTNIGTEPTDFDTNAAFDGQTALQPQWGSCP